MYDEKLLFDVVSGHRREKELLELRDIYSSRQWDVREEVETWDSARLLVTDEADIIDDLLARHSIVCPVLHREQAEQLPADQRWLMTKLVIAVPFNGDADVFNAVGDELFQAQAKKGDTKKGELFLAWNGGTRDKLDPATVLHEFSLRLGKIERQLSQRGPGIARANADLSKWVTARIASLRAGLLADRKLQEVLGIPVRQQADAAQFEVPVMRRKISAPRRPDGTGRFEPEPFLPEDHYEQALAALLNSRNTLERIPLATAHLGEETIRDLLLGFLNTVFGGAAAGEVSNRIGKTDILIRVEDRNVFIAECKIWNGPDRFRKGLEQLLSYLAWRDDKAALLLFIRNGQTTSIISKAIAVIEGHPNFKRTLNASEYGERCDFVLHANDDPSKEIRLAFLSFLLLDRP